MNIETSLCDNTDKAGLLKGMAAYNPQNELHVPQADAVNQIKSLAENVLTNKTDVEKKLVELQKELDKANENITLQKAVIKDLEVKLNVTEKEKKEKETVNKDLTSRLQQALDQTKTVLDVHLSNNENAQIGLVNNIVQIADPTNSDCTAIMDTSGISTGFDVTEVTNVVHAKSDGTAGETNLDVYGCTPIKIKEKKNVMVGNQNRLINIIVNNKEAIASGQFKVLCDEDLLSLIWSDDEHQDQQTTVKIKCKFRHINGTNDPASIEQKILARCRLDNPECIKLFETLNSMYKAVTKHIRHGCILFVLSTNSIQDAQQLAFKTKEIKELFEQTILPSNTEIEITILPSHGNDSSIQPYISICDFCRTNKSTSRCKECIKNMCATCILCHNVLLPSNNHTIVDNPATVDTRTGDKETTTIRNIKPLTVTGEIATPIDDITTLTGETATPTGTITPPTDEIFIVDFVDDLPQVKEMRIVMVGKTGVGKSALGNSLLRSRPFKSITTAGSVTSKCKFAQGNIRDGTPLCVIDTPGIFDTRQNNEETTMEIVRCVGLSAPGPHVFLFVLSISRFTKEELDTVNHLVDVFGEDVIKYVVIVFTGKESLIYDKQTLSEYIKDAPPELREVVQRCRSRYATIDNRANKADVQADVDGIFNVVRRTIKENDGYYYKGEMYRAAEEELKKKMRLIDEEKHKKEIQLQERHDELERQERELKETDTILKQEHENMKRTLEAELVALRNSNLRQEVREEVEQSGGFFPKFVESLKGVFVEPVKHVVSKVKEGCTIS